MTKDGMAVFNKPPTGTYRIYVKGAGFEEATAEVKVIAGKDLERVISVKSIKQH
jgi:hypothetical protein